MKTRMVKVEYGDKVWFEAQYRFLYFFWRSCYVTMYDDVARYSTWGEAAAAIQQFRQSQITEKRTVCRDY